MYATPRRIPVLVHSWPTAFQACFSDLSKTLSSLANLRGGEMGDIGAQRGFVEQCSKARDCAQIEHKQAL
jgi:hypothetical protein